MATREVVDCFAVALTDIVVRPERNPRGKGPHKKIDELASSLQERGQLHPLIVRTSPDDACKFLLISGHRRYEAATKLGWDTIDVKLMNVDDLGAALIALTENGHREDIDPYLEAEEWERIIKTYDISQAELARRLSVSEASVSTRLKTLRESVPELRAAVQKGEVHYSMARDVSGLPASSQRELLAEIRKKTAAGNKTTTADVRRTIEDRKHEQSQSKCGSLLAKDDDIAAKLAEMKKRAHLRRPEELIIQWGETKAKLCRSKVETTKFKLNAQIDALEWALRIRTSL
jgi:ParB family transcriptional regulator, chromosome partitioning protein